jgi:TonB family protein
MLPRVFPLKRSYVVSIFRISLLLLIAALAYCQDVAKPAEKAPTRHVSVADFGISYPLSSDWVLATELMRKKMTSDGSSPDFEVLLAAVYVPKSKMSSGSPFFSLLVNRRPGADCRKSLEAMIAKSQDTKNKAEGGVVQFSAAGRDYFRVDMAHGIVGRHRSVICSIAGDHLLAWQASASDDKGMNLIVETLNSITALPPRSAGAVQSSEQKAGETPNNPAKLIGTAPTRVRIASGVAEGLLVKRVQPVYPMWAREMGIQGTVVLQAEISKEGDITDLELISGSIELAGSAVAAMRQWKYKPFLLNGEPVTVQTQVLLDYGLLHW